MNIVSTQFTLEYNALDIYIAGCAGQPKCVGCHNEELWDFNAGKPYTEWLPAILEKIESFNNLIDNVMVFGGEPLDQNIDDLVDFLKKLKATGKKIWVFTRLNLRDVPDIVIENLDYIKTGRYLPELKTDNNIQFGIKLATSNQNIWSFYNG